MIRYFIVLHLALFSSQHIYVQAVSAEEMPEARKVAYTISFSDYLHGSIDEWMRQKGFVFEKDAKDRKKIDLDIQEDAVVFRIKKQSRGFLFNEYVKAEKFSRVRISWGIIKFPKDASYEKKINNEALMLYVFFGKEKIASGNVAIPASPYFIALFLGENDTVNRPYTGRYFHKSGRFVCVGNPKPGETVVTEFDLKTAFGSYFDKKTVPPISGISLGFDTSSSGAQGQAAAFIKSIEFLE